MKTKLAAALMLVVIAVSMLYGCGLIQVNSDRDMAQVIATVGDDDYKDEILKKDLANIFVQQGSQYIQQYQLSVGQTMELLLNQLINNRVIIQEAAKILIENNDLSGNIKDYLGKDSETDKKSVSMRKLVGEEAYNRALSETYKYEKEMLDYYEEQIKKENPDAEPEPTPEPSPSPRPTREPDVEPEPSPNPPNTIDEEGEAYRRIISALKKKSKEIKSDKEFYEEFFEGTLVSMLENEIIELYRQLLIEDIRINYDKMEERINNMRLPETYQYAIDLSSYGTKLQNADENTFILYNPVSGYGYVKNLLISFDDKLSDQLAILKNREWSKAQYLQHRDVLLQQITVKDLANEENEEVLDIDTFYQQKLIDSYGGVADNSYDNVVYKTGKSGQALEDDIDDFIDLIFKYGTDPGMFNNKMDYLVAPKPESGQETYVTEFAKAARDVIDAGEGSFTIVGTDFGWHIILCTEVLLAGDIKEIDQDIYNDIESFLENGTKFDEIDRNTKNTLTYKLYKVMREELKNSTFNTEIAKVFKNYEEKIERFESRYKNFLELK